MIDPRKNHKFGPVRWCCTLKLGLITIGRLQIWWRDLSKHKLLYHMRGGRAKFFKIGNFALGLKVQK